MALTMSESAVARVEEILREEGNPDLWLRVGIRGGGCSGLTYFMDFVEAPEEKDKTFDHGNGVKVCVDVKSYLFLNGTELDFEKTLMREGFVFHNPLAKRSCSCGESFTL